MSPDGTHLLWVGAFLYFKGKPATLGLTSVENLSQIVNFSVSMELPNPSNSPSPSPTPTTSPTPELTPSPTASLSPGLTPSQQPRFEPSSTWTDFVDGPNLLPLLTGIIIMLAIGTIGAIIYFKRGKKKY